MIASNYWEDFEGNFYNLQIKLPQMLIFFIHGVSTKNSRYADTLIANIEKKLAKSNVATNFYSSFWGNLFNNKKHQIVGCIQKDFLRACEQHKEYKGWYHDIYRYQEQRNQIINNFLGDFLIYQNPKRGALIRKTILEQFTQYIKDHPEQTQIHFVAHSLGSVILWDLLFSDTLSSEDPAFAFREKLTHFNLASITTLGSPLLFLKQMLDLDFSTVNAYFQGVDDKHIEGSHKLRWVNIIHSSDLVAYPLKASVEDELSSEIMFSDQYVWQDANGVETMLHVGSRQSNLAMFAAAEDAHSSYFQKNLDGRITARIIAYNLLGQTEKLLERCVTSK